MNLLDLNFPPKDISFNFLEKYNINNNIKLFSIQVINVPGSRAWFIFIFYLKIFYIKWWTSKLINKNYPTSTLNVEKI